MFVVSVTRITISDHPPSERIRAKDAKTRIILKWHIPIRNILLLYYVWKYLLSNMVCFTGYAESCVNEGEIVNVLTIKNMMCFTCMCKVSTRTHIITIITIIYNYFVQYFCIEYFSMTLNIIVTHNIYLYM